MIVSPGTRLGPYEINGLLGAGGMGEVYRARDPRLGRDVAIKILPAEMGNADLLARFEQEARAASALNHPNIITIYEIGRAEGSAYIAMELVSGSSLRELAAGGSLPTRRLLAVAVQIADGLARAHEAGIVHRDLKPENVMINRDGHVKILDFGLAKVVAVAETPASQIPTSIEPTRPGLVMGTVGYMSPEQASGRPIDFRSDQFAFGSIIYELAAGRRPFSRETSAETLTAILREEPEPLQSAAPGIPVTLRWIVERCLAKDPTERYASTRDLARDLAHLKDHVSEVSSAVAIAPPPSRRRSLLWPAVAAATLLAAVLLTFTSLRRPPAPEAQPARFAIPIPAGASYAPEDIERGFSISPDGTRLIIEAESGGHRRLYERRLDSEEARPLEGSSDALSHFWSPDGRFLAFFANGRLRKIPAAGGPAEELCEAPLPFVGSWSSSGTILFSSLDPPGIYSVPSTGGKPARLLAPDPARQEANLIWPHFLPDGRRFLYMANSRKAGRELRIGSLDSKETRSVGTITSRVEYAAPGYLVLAREGAIFAQPFDQVKAELRGEPRLLASGAHYFFGPSHATFSVSQTGVLAYQTARPPSRLTWYDRTGKALGTLGEPAVIHGLRIAPDGLRAAVDIQNLKTGTSDIWVYDIASGVPTRLHSDPTDEGMPVWSADGTKVFYRSDRNGPPDIYEMTPGSGSEKPVLALPGVQLPEDASRDGRMLAYVNIYSGTVRNIWLLSLENRAKPTAWRQPAWNEMSPRFSPDGAWIAYESDETGETEVYVARTEGGGDKRRISPAGGKEPRWRRDGKELYYVGRGGSLMSVPIVPSPTWQAGSPAVLFQGEAEIENYEVAPDGSRFLASVPAERLRASPLRVILNWPALAKKTP